MMGLLKVKELIVYTEKKLLRFNSSCGIVRGQVLTLLHEAKDACIEFCFFVSCKQLCF